MWVEIAEKFSEVRGQDHSETKGSFAVEAYVLTVWRRGSLFKYICYQF